MALKLGMEYQHHCSSAGWEFNRSSSAPSINNMLSTIHRASELPNYDNQQWRSSWDSSRPPMDHERPGSFASPTDGKDSRSQRLPSLRSILNSPPPVSRPSQISAPPRNEVLPNGVPRSASPQFFREDVASSGPRRMGAARNDSVTPVTPGRLGYSNAPVYYHDGHAQHGMHDPHVQKLSIQTHSAVPLVAAPAHQRTSSASQGSGPGMQSDKTLSPEDQSDMPRNALKRRSEAPRGPPRITKCVGQKNVPGEGLCWLYEDGSYCRTVIDGERVNPNWGVTKAGRPRKRLAQACLTCREKKIKCEPAYPKCHQCAKSQRVCKGGMSQYLGTEAQPAESPAGTRDPSSGPNAAGSPMDRSSANSVNEATSAADSSDSPKSAKRARTFSISSGKGYFDYPGSSNTAITPGSELVDPLDRDSYPLSLGWEQDPFEANPKHTVQLLDLYFTHIASATYCMFPKTQFLAWVENCKTKSQDDRMLLYSVLAMGSTFAVDHMLRALGKHLAEIASHALERRVGKFTLQLCQARLLISLYQWSQGKAGETIAWDMSASAFRAISALSLNTEKGVANFDDDDLTYGFDRVTLEECRRRTFWSGFLMDRYNGFCGGTMCVFNHDDIFLRLPCRESELERLDSVQPRPYFDYDALLNPEPSAPMVSGAMAQLVLVSAIWGDVFSTTARAVHRAESPSYPATYHKFKESTTRRLQNWLANLPAQFRYSTENLDKSIAHGYAGTFVSLHALYHTSHIRLNRHMRHSALPASTVAGCVQTSRQHSRSLLSIMQSLSRVSRSARFSVSDPHNQTARDFSFSTPFPGYAFMNAVDVLSAGGLLSSLPALISFITAGLSCVEELAEFWSSGKAQLKALRTRVKLLGDVATGDKPDAVVHSVPFDGSEKGWRLKTGLEPSFEKEDDSAYGTGASEAFWDGVLKDADASAA